MYSKSRLTQTMEYYILSAKSLCEQLEQLNYTISDPLERANKAADMIRKTLSSFRNMMREEDFKSMDDEIYFFKYTKPQITAYLIFYSILAEMESLQLMLSKDDMKEFIEKKHRMFRHILRENIEFVRYYKSGMTHFDSLYFLRGTNPYGYNRLSTTQLLDPEFNTSHDLVAANLMAFDLFQKHFAPRPDLQPTYGPPAPKLKWTASKSDFIEFVYGLHASAAVNYGDVEIIELCQALQSIFKIQIEDPYRIFIDLCNRKTAPVKFIPKLEEGFLRKVEEMGGKN